ALDILQAAERPVVIAGSGVWWADAGAELRRFLALTRLPHYSLALGRGVIPDEFRYSMGYADPALNRAVTRAFPEADAVLVLGKRVDSRLSLGGPPLFSPDARFVQIDIHAPELGHTRRLELGVCADLKSALRMMNEAARERRWPDRKAWLARLRRYRRDWQAELERHAAEGRAPIHPAALFFELKRRLPPCLYAWDGGEFVHWGRAILPATRPGGWVRLGPLATIGAGLPNAVGLQIAHPNERVLMITGDGSLGFYLAELDTLVRHRLPVVIIVGNDGAWGVERELQSAVYGTTVGCELRRSRYDRIMKGFGGRAEHITRLGQLAPALKRAFASGEPYLLNVEIRPARSPFSEWVIQRKRRAARRACR
ncbi:MAG TPA: thiamine pyrophosphate-binding protein, partial [Thermopetrobacter sp.]|nr:thiamine pyrophosphate-binding protein [Thermopetrobacter sp.]